MLAAGSVLLGRSMDGAASTTPLTFLCHVVLPDVKLLIRILEKSGSAGTTFGMYFNEGYLYIQTVMAQDKLAAEAAIHNSYFLSGTSPVSAYSRFQTKQRTAAMLSFLKKEIDSEHSSLSHIDQDDIEHKSSGSAPSDTTAASVPPLQTGQQQQQQPVMISWLDEQGRIAVHLHPKRCTAHGAQVVDDWKSHIVHACQSLAAGLPTNPYIATFEPVTDRHERIIQTQSLQRIQGMSIALRLAKGGEFSNKARDAALIAVGPVAFSWHDNILSVLGIGATAVYYVEVAGLPHATARQPLDFLTNPVAANGSANAASNGSANAASNGSANAASNGSANAAANAAAATVTPIKKEEQMDDDVIDDSDDLELDYAVCSDRMSAQSLITPTLLNIAAKILSTIFTNQPNLPAFMWYNPRSLGGTGPPPNVIFGTVIPSEVPVRWFVHIEQSMSSSIEYCPGIVWSDRPDIFPRLHSLP